jgi:PHD/YefM family antitoxin component YafN of YafNO toxin-antitoxin module
MIMQTETLSYVKEHANHLEIDGPLLITQKGKARFVLQNVEDYEYQQESLALLKLLLISDKTANEEVLSIEHAFAD